MRRGWVAAIAAVGVSVAVSAAAMQQSGEFPQRAAGIFLRHAERQLALSDAQRDQIRSILKAEEPAIATLAQRVHREREELHGGQVFDEEQVRAFARQHESTTEDVLVEREKIRSEILGVLTPEQKLKAEKLHEQIYQHLMQRLNFIGDSL